MTTIPGRKLLLAGGGAATLLATGGAATVLSSDERPPAHTAHPNPTA
jgi:hypothetical protein